MTDIVTIKGKITQWERVRSGDRFTIKDLKDKKGEGYSFTFSTLIPESWKLLDAMRDRKDIEIVVRVVDE